LLYIVIDFARKGKVGKGGWKRVSRAWQEGRS